MANPGMDNDIFDAFILQLLIAKNMLREFGVGV